MSDSMITFIIIISEAAAFFAVIIVLTLVYRFRKKIKLKRIAKDFVKRIKSESAEHSEKLKVILLNDYNLDEAVAEEAVEGLIKQEYTLFSKIIEMYLGSKNTSLEGINEDVKNLTKIMHFATVSYSSNDDSDDTTDSKFLSDKFEELKKQLEQVKQEKQQVESQLQDAMDTMEGMMTEYASMYSGGAKDDKNDPESDIAKVKDKIKEIKQKSNLNEEKNTGSPKDEIDLNVDVPDLDIDDES